MNTLSWSPPSALANKLGPGADRGEDLADVIINVSGTTSATLMNAGFSGPTGGSSIPTALNRILWNFPHITSLTVQSVGFPGSILAPVANTTLKWGSLSGTAVVKSASSSAELYMHRYQVPGRGGCLDLDANWSCSNDTTLDFRSKTAAGIGPEAGFIFFQGGQYKAEGLTTSRTSASNRVWYSFHPASYTTKEAPLAVFFNGGPGAGTMPLLFAFNTAPMTLDPDVVRTSKIAPNQNSWTKFANLLYIDAPSTGFSYAVAEPDGTKPSVGTDIDEDSAIVLRVVVQFILRHPQISSNRVILVGESYGGIRATLMLQELYAYASLASGAFQDSRLSADLRQYFSAVFGTESPQASQIASRFGHQVLIQPGLVGQEQLEQDGFDPSVCRSPGCLSTDNGLPPTCDMYFCDQEFGWFDKQRNAAATNLATVSVLTRALGVDPTTIRWMYSDARRNAYGRPIVGSTYVANPQMAEIFGKELQPDDQYLMIQSKAAGSTYGGVSRWWSKSGVGAETGADFARHLVNGVATFMTSAKFDSAIHSPDIPAALNYLATLDRDKPGHVLTDFQQLVCSAHYDPFSQTELDRRGMAWMNYTVPRVEAWVLPSYESGHSITMRQPAALLADVMDWYRSSAHL